MPLEWIAAIGWLAALTNATATIFWVRYAGSLRRKGVEARAVATGERERARAELDSARRQLDGLRVELEHVRKRASYQNVAALVPAGVLRARPDEDTAGFLRKALRAQIAWFNDCPAVLPFHTLICSPELDGEVRHVMACELYARAILESALAAHLDGTNPRSDRAVLRQLGDSLGEAFCERVRLDVEARGVVFQEAASTAPVQA